MTVSNRIYISLKTNRGSSKEMKRWLMTMKKTK